MKIVDILIVPDQTDLNIYKTTSDDNTGIGCCGSGCNGKQSCASNDVVKKDGKTRDIDLNKWASKLVVSITDTTFNRTYI